VIRALEVVATGPLALVEDLGRLGYAAVGVGRSGAADRAAYLLAGRLLGEPVGRAAVEVTLGGLVVRARGSLTVVVTGAAAPATVDGRPVGHAAPVHLPDGAVLALGMPPTGLRSYLAVRGGIDLDPVLGSRSSDTLSGIGPAPLRVGQVVPVGEPGAGGPTMDVAPVAAPEGGRVELTLLPGPRLDWLADPRALTATPWTVSGSSDRVGMRLTGPALSRGERWADAELPSEGVVVGGVQVPADGQPIVFLADHPVTGGYPVVAVVRAADVDRAAQCRPGQDVRLRWAVAPR
jgi:biotin-dependent carboxylase-like uncharacterized protein